MYAKPKQTFLDRILDAILQLRIWIAFESAADDYRRKGSVVPYLDAWLEGELLQTLDSFRDWASDTYLAERCPVSELRTRWIRDNLKPMMRIPGGAEKAKALADIINAMPAHEVLHRDALAVFERDVDAMRFAGDGRR